MILSRMTQVLNFQFIFSREFERFSLEKEFRNSTKAIGIGFRFPKETSERFLNKKSHRLSRRFSRPLIISNFCCTQKVRGSASYFELLFEILSLIF